MAIFFHSLRFIPDADRKKTILKDGNPFRMHYIMGIGMLKASLYKSPINPHFQIHTVYEDEEFDKDDIAASEMMIIEEVIQSILREVERISGDSKIRYKEHYIVGFDLAKQLGMLYKKAIDYQIHLEENIYHAIMGAKWIDLSTLMAMVHNKRSTLKPGFIPPSIVNSTGHLTSLSDLDPIFDSQDGFALTQILQSDIQKLLGYYHEILKFNP